MKSIYDHSAAKKPTNLSVNKDLLTKAKQLNINLSATLEKALAVEVSKRQAEEWLKANQKGLEACNEFVEKNGLFSDAFRDF